jgi:hypothetical protein
MDEEVLLQKQIELLSQQIGNTARRPPFHYAVNNKRGRGAFARSRGSARFAHRSLDLRSSSTQTTSSVSSSAVAALNQSSAASVSGAAHSVVVQPKLSFSRVLHPQSAAVTQHRRSVRLRKMKLARVAAKKKVASLRFAAVLSERAFPSWINKRAQRKRSRIRSLSLQGKLLSACSD